MTSLNDNILYKIDKNYTVNIKKHKKKFINWKAVKRTY